MTEVNDSKMLYHQREYLSKELLEQRSSYPCIVVIETESSLTGGMHADNVYSESSYYSSLVPRLSPTESLGTRLLL